MVTELVDAFLTILMVVTIVLGAWVYRRGDGGWRLVGAGLVLLGGSALLMPGDSRAANLALAGVTLLGLTMSWVGINRVRPGRSQ